MSGLYLRFDELGSNGELSLGGSAGAEKEELLRWKVKAAIHLQVIQWLSFEAEPLVLHQHCGTSSSLVLSNLMLLE